MKLKKIAAMLMAGVMCIGLMAGCGSSDKNAQTDSTDPKSSRRMDIRTAMIMKVLTWIWHRPFAITMAGSW